MQDVANTTCVEALDCLASVSERTWVLIDFGQFEDGARFVVDVTNAECPRARACIDGSTADAFALDPSVPLPSCALDSEVAPLPTALDFAADQPSAAFGLGDAGKAAAVGVASAVGDASPKIGDASPKVGDASPKVGAGLPWEGSAYSRLAEAAAAAKLEEPAVHVIGSLESLSGQVTVRQEQGNYLRICNWDRISSDSALLGGALLRTLPQCGCGGSLGTPKLFKSFAEMSAYHFCAFYLDGGA